MKKRILRILLCGVILAGLLPMAALACPYCSYTREEGYHYAWEGKTETTHNVMCPYCGYKWTENHLFDHTYRRAATCTEDGSEYDLCYCGHTIATRTIPAPGHDLEHHDAKSPTCTEEGWEAYDTCKREGCEYTTYKEIDAPGHDFEHHDAKSPTCTEEGWEAYDTCKREGCEYTTYKEIDAPGHDLEHHDAKSPTCTEEGWEAYDTCKREGCEYTTYKEIDALGHDLELHEAKNPTCTEEGNIEYYKCNRCDMLFADAAGNVEIPAEKTVVAATGSALNSPKTGDTGSLALWITLLFVGGGAGILTFVYAKRKAAVSVCRAEKADIEGF